MSKNVRAFAQWRVQPERMPTGLATGKTVYLEKIDMGTAYTYLS